MGSSVALTRPISVSVDGPVKVIDEIATTSNEDCAIAYPWNLDRCGAQAKAGMLCGDAEDQPDQCTGHHQN